ncbi:hypothetical protein Q0F98_17800 [Paenibacillus amylolyticus]|nr:hypothetical protein Q0F98_17800 [Paenibacillus amylolyticus]
MFRFGDGGGGPTEEMLEHGRRLDVGLPGVPAVKRTFVREFSRSWSKIWRMFLPFPAGQVSCIWSITGVPTLPWRVTNGTTVIANLRWPMPSCMP